MGFVWDANSRTVGLESQQGGRKGCLYGPWKDTKDSACQSHAISFAPSGWSHQHILQVFCLFHSTSLWKRLTIVDTAFFLCVQYTPVLGENVAEHQSCNSLTIMCWDFCRIEGRIKYFLTADGVYVVSFIWIRVEIMQWLVFVVKCSHSRVPLSVLGRSPDPPFH